MQGLDAAGAFGVFEDVDCWETEYQGGKEMGGTMIKGGGGSVCICCLCMLCVLYGCHTPHTLIWKLFCSLSILCFTTIVSILLFLSLSGPSIYSQDGSTVCFFWRSLECELCKVVYPPVVRVVDAHNMSKDQQKQQQVNNGKNEKKDDNVVGSDLHRRKSDSRVNYSKKVFVVVVCILLQIFECCCASLCFYCCCCCPAILIHSLLLM